MRFVAWAGLSEGYRRAVDGHSPWTRDVKDPQPICIADVATSDLPEALKATVRRKASLLPFSFRSSSTATGRQVHGLLRGSPRL